MRRSLLLGLTVVLLAGCQSLQDQEALRPLPETGPKPLYSDLLLRARRQSELALNRAMSNQWTEVEDASKALDQTVRLLPSAQEAPEKKPEVEKLWAALGEDGKKLGTAAREIATLTGEAKEKKQKELDDLLLRIGRNVRLLRAMN